MRSGFGCCLGVIDIREIVDQLAQLLRGRVAPGAGDDTTTSPILQQLVFLPAWVLCNLTSGQFKLMFSAELGFSDSKCSENGEGQLLRLILTCLLLVI